MNYIPREHKTPPLRVRARVYDVDGGRDTFKPPLSALGGRFWRFGVV